MASSRQGDVYAGVIAPLVPACIVICLRFYARRLRRNRVWWDDYLAVLALISVFVYDGFTLWALLYGLGLHLTDLPVSIEKARYAQALMQEVQEHTYTVSIGASQLSLIALYWRIFQAMDGARRAIHILMGCIIVWVLIRIPVSVFQCYPPAFFWDKSLNGKCTISAANYFLGSVSSHLLIDVCLIILPATQINRLSLPFEQKTACAMMFMFGIVVCAASIVMLVVSSQYNPEDPDLMWHCTPPAVWSSVEIHLSIVSCCLPILRPVVYVFSGWWTSKKGSYAESFQPSIKLQRIFGQRPQGESTWYLHSTVHSVAEPERLHIHGQDVSHDTVIIGSGGQENNSSEAQSVTTVKSGVIKVRYEVDLSFSGGSQSVPQPPLPLRSKPGTNSSHSKTLSKSDS